MKPLIVGLITGVLCLAASVPWGKKRPEQWTNEDVQRILSNSPWAQSANATFPDPRKDERPESVYSMPGAAQAGMAGSRGATDGRWDGGVGRNTGIGLMPTLPVIVRWDSALPVRQALSRQKASSEVLGEPKDYIITVEGLVPAGQYRRTGQLQTKSSSDGTTENVNDPEHLLEGLMAHSKLLIKGRTPLPCQDAKVDPETGAVHLSFLKSFEIRPSDKEVTFTTRFGSLSVEKRFRLSDMTYNRKLEL